MLSLLSKITNPEDTSQLKVMKDPNSNRLNDLFLIKTIPVTIHNSWLTFRDTDENFRLEEDLLKMMNNKNYKDDLVIRRVKN